MHFSFKIFDDKGKPLSKAVVSFIGSNGEVVEKLVTNPEGVAIVEATPGAGILYPDNQVSVSANGFHTSTVLAQQIAVDNEFWLTRKTNVWLLGLKVAAVVAALLLVSSQDKD